MTMEADLRHYFWKYFGREPGHSDDGLEETFEDAWNLGAASKDARIAELEKKSWTCAARAAPSTPYGVQDCDWPHCGCDTQADKVLAALDEEGYPSPADVAVLNKRIAELEAMLAEATHIHQRADDGKWYFDDGAVPHGPFETRPGAAAHATAWDEMHAKHAAGQSAELHSSIDSLTATLRGQSDLLRKLADGAVHGGNWAIADKLYGESDRLLAKLPAAPRAPMEER